MTCLECSPSRLRLGDIGRRLRQTARLMVGQPDYDTYLAHRAKSHPDEAPMSPKEFFRNREDHRFGGGVSTGGFRCC
jgi:uncharacterized short protein YbdD (DUF466 family)